MKNTVRHLVRRVMVFGTFDGLHPGHIHFLTQAKKLGGYLIVVVGRDRAVSRLKMKTPRHHEKARVAMLKKCAIPDRVILGDAKQGQWSVVKKIKPDIIALGYDQGEIRKSLQDNSVSLGAPFIIKWVSAHHGHHLHTRLLQIKSTTKRA